MAESGIKCTKKAKDAIKAVLDHEKHWRKGESTRQGCVLTLANKPNSTTKRVICSKKLKEGFCLNNLVNLLKGEAKWVLLVLGYSVKGSSVRNTNLILISWVTDDHPVKEKMLTSSTTKTVMAACENKAVLVPIHEKVDIATLKSILEDKAARKADKGKKPCKFSGRKSEDAKRDAAENSDDDDGGEDAHDWDSTDDESD